MRKLIEFLEEQLQLSTKDLEKSDAERNKLIGKIELLEQIKVLDERGYPDEEEEK